MLTPQDIKEELSYAYVHAVAARAGYAVVRPSKDRDSIDAIIEAGEVVAADQVTTSPKLELQLKATARAKLSANEFAFKLPVKNYNDLRRATMCPRLLVVLVLPAQEAQWLECSEDALLAKRCAYWTYLKAYPPTTNTTTRTVKLQRSNRFTVESLRELMARASRFEDLLQ